MDGPCLLIRSDGHQGWRLSWRLPGQTTRQGTAAEATRELAGRRCVVFVPGTDVLLTEVNLPTRNRQRLLQAIPFALEEQLCEDPDVLHYALGPREAGSDRLPVAVVARSRMGQWLALLQEAGVQAQALVPDMLGLPQDDADWQVAVEDGLARVRTGAVSGFTVEREALTALLGMALDEAGRDNAPARILVNDFHAEAGDAETGIPTPQGGRVEQATARDNLLALLSESYKPELAIDLLQGPYSRREQIDKRLRPWLGVAAMALLWVIVMGLGGVIDYRRLGQQATTNQARIDALYLAVFPKGRKQADYTIYQSQMKQELATLQSQGGGGSGFLGLLHKVGGVLKDSTVELQGSQYRDGTLDLDLRAGNLESLDQLKQALGNDSTLEVELQNAASRNGRVEGRLRIRGHS